jgi:hypothetical protein
MTASGANAKWRRVCFSAVIRAKADLEHAGSVPVALQVRSAKRAELSLAKGLVYTVSLHCEFAQPFANAEGHPLGGVPPTPGASS